METLKIKSTHPESQGAFVVINEEDFDPEIHELFEDDDEDAADPPSRNTKRVRAIVASRKHK